MDEFHSLDMPGIFTNSTLIQVDKEDIQNQLRFPVEIVDLILSLLPNHETYSYIHTHIRELRQMIQPKCQVFRLTPYKITNNTPSLPFRTDTTTDDPPPIGEMTTIDVGYRTLNKLSARLKAYMKDCNLKFQKILSGKRIVVLKLILEKESGDLEFSAASRGLKDVMEIFGTELDVKIKARLRFHIEIIKKANGEFVSLKSSSIVEAEEESSANSEGVLGLDCSPAESVDIAGNHFSQFFIHNYLYISPSFTHRPIKYDKINKETVISCGNLEATLRDLDNSLLEECLNSPKDDKDSANRGIHNDIKGIGTIQRPSIDYIFESEYDTLNQDLKLVYKVIFDSSEKLLMKEFFAMIKRSDSRRKFKKFELQGIDEIMKKVVDCIQKMNPVQDVFPELTETLNGSLWTSGVIRGLAYEKFKLISPVQRPLNLMISEDDLMLADREYSTVPAYLKLYYKLIDLFLKVDAIKRVRFQMQVDGYVVREMIKKEKTIRRRYFNRQLRSTVNLYSGKRSKKPIKH